MNNIYQMFSVERKKVLITGAANGNGAAISRGFGQAGGILTLIDVDELSLEQVACEIERETNTYVERFLVDLGDDLALENFLAAHSEFDVVINNAGVTRGNDIFHYEDDDWELTHKINVTAPYKIIKRVCKSMCVKGSGSIINITSLAAEQGFPGNPAYASAKGALKQLSKAVACDVSAFGVRVNSVGPGYFKTNMTKKSWNDTDLREKRSKRIILDRWGEPDDLVGILIFLASDSSSYITGQDFYVDGGWLSKGL